MNLKPCPFCGGEAKIVGLEDHGPFFVLCWGFCGAAMGQSYDWRNIPEHKFKTLEAARDAWNKRGSSVAAVLDEALNSGDGTYKP